MNKYSRYNKIAKDLINEYNEKLFENEQVDSILVKVVDNALNIFKILVFDLAPKRDRNPNILRTKLSNIINSKKVKSLTAKILDYADDNDIIDSSFDDAKKLYLEALSNLVEALNRTSEISSSKDEIIFKQFKIAANKLQNSIDGIAKNVKKEMETNENYSTFYDYYSINESLFNGYQNRVDRIKKVLIDLISSAEGKNQKNGYYRDWKRIFLELDEKRKILDKADGGERSRKALDELEKQLEKFQNEFNSILISTTNKLLQKLEAEEEVYDKYSDVVELINTALDLMTRAKTQYTLAITDIKSNIEANENEVIQKVFPIKRGDKDSDKKFKNAGLIFAIQKALIDAIPSANKLITSNGGPNGKYGPSTSAVIAGIQKITGNKNANGDLDHALLNDIVISDWISKENKIKIKNSLDKIGAKMNESKENVVSIADFLFLYEGKISMDKNELGKEINVIYKNMLDENPNIEKENINDNDIIKEINTLSKKLRKKYNLKIEEEYFIKNDKTLKSAYSPEFINAWNKALDQAEPEDEYSYFFFDEGLYNISIKASSLKTPANWRKWLEVRQLSTFDADDSVKFIDDYLKGWNTFGIIKMENRYEAISSLFKINDDNEDSLFSGEFEMMKDSIKHKEIPFIEFSDLKQDIKKAFDTILQIEENEPDLGKDEFTALNNFLIMVANAITFDGDNYISCIKWINDNIIKESTSKRIINDSIVDSKNSQNKIGQLLTYKDKELIIGEYNDIKDIIIKKNKEVSNEINNISMLSSLMNDKNNAKGIKGILGNNCYIIASKIYPSIDLHLARINSTEFKKIPQKGSFKIINIEEDN